VSNQPRHASHIRHTAPCGVGARGATGSVRRRTPRERDPTWNAIPSQTPEVEGDNLFGNPEKVDGSIEEDLDARLQAEQDEDVDDE